MSAFIVLVCFEVIGVMIFLFLIWFLFNEVRLRFILGYNFGAFSSQT